MDKGERRDDLMDPGPSSNKALAGIPSSATFGAGGSVKQDSPKKKDKKKDKKK